MPLGWGAIKLVLYVGSMAYNWYEATKASNRSKESTRLGKTYHLQSSYGIDRTIGFGTIPVPGRMIWSKGIRETEEADGFKYHATFAIGFGEGVADGPLKVFMDGKCVYNSVGQTTPGVKHLLHSNQFTFHSGSEDQEPDIEIEALEGDGETPAFRGECYMVIRDYSLEDFNWGYPSEFSAELAYVSSASRPVNVSDLLTEAEGGRLDGYSTTMLAVDFDRRFAYLFDNTGTGDELDDTGFRKINLDTMEEVLQVTLRESGVADYASAIGANTACCVTSSGDLVISPGAGNCRPILVLDKDTLTVKASFGVEGSTVTWQAPSAAYPSGIAPATWYSGLTTMSRLQGGQREDFVVVGTTFESVGVLRLPDLEYVWDSDTAGYDLSPGYSSQNIFGVAGGHVGETEAEAYILVGNPDNLSVPVFIHKVQLRLVESVSASLLHTQTMDNLVGGTASSGLSLGGLCYWEYNGEQYLFYQAWVQIVGASHKVVWGRLKISGTVDYDVLWVSLEASAAIGEQSGVTNSRLIGGTTLGWVTKKTTTTCYAWLMDLTDGRHLVDGDVFDYSPALGSGVWDGTRGTCIGPSEGGEGVCEWFVGRAAGESTRLDDIIETLAIRSGLEASDVDVSQIADIEVPGYLIVSQTTARDAMRDLCVLLLVDPVESDFILKFTPKSGTPVRTIPYNELLDAGDEPPVSVTRKDELELPLRFSVSYLQIASQNTPFPYKEDTQSARRILAPTPAMKTQEEHSISVPVALTATKAKQIAEIMLYSTWESARALAFKLPQKHIDLDPGDVVRVYKTATESTVMRLEEASISDSYELDAKGTLVGEDSYTSTVTADGGGQGDDSTVAASDDRVELALLDSPLLTDTDAPDGDSTDEPMYYAMGGYADNGFSGGRLYNATGGWFYVYLDSAPTGMSWGAIIPDPDSHEFELGDPPGGLAHITDAENAIRVAMYVGESDLVSVTQLEMLNGANRAAIVRPAGEVEIVHFRDVEHIVSNIYRLTGLLRGRRGTDAMAEDHGAGELFVLLNGAVRRVDMPLYRSGTYEYWKGIAPGENLEEADYLKRWFYGRSLMPYAPCHVKLETSGVSDVRFSWMRRTRIGNVTAGQAMAVGDMPVSESSERYELQLYERWVRGVVYVEELRRTEEVTDPEFVYTWADQQNDGWDLRTTPSTRRIFAKISQLSGHSSYWSKGFVRTVIFRREGVKYLVE